jgi:hypothetical protein
MNQTAWQKAQILAQQWPYHPYLPMKRWLGERAGGGFADLQLGVLYAGQWHVVYLGNLHTLYGKPLEVLECGAKLTYTDLDALLTAGWRGD